MKSKIKVGLFFFARNRSNWSVYCYDVVNEETGFSSANKIDTYFTFEEALRATYKLNGWTQPRKISRTF
jgi:hypothetical protein